MLIYIGYNDQVVFGGYNIVVCRQTDRHGGYRFLMPARSVLGGLFINIKHLRILLEEGTE